MELLIALSGSGQKKYQFFELKAPHHIYPVMFPPANKESKLPIIRKLKVNTVFGVRSSSTDPDWLLAVFPEYGFEEFKFRRSRFDNLKVFLKSFPEDKALALFANPKVHEDRTKLDTPYIKQLRKLLDLYGDDKLFEKAKVSQTDALLYLDSVWMKAKKTLGIKNLKKPKFKVVEGKHAGYFNKKTREVFISFSLIQKTVEAKILELILHEFAHLYACELSGASLAEDKGHGREWVTWMKKIGLPPITEYTKKGSSAFES